MSHNGIPYCLSDIDANRAYLDAAIRRCKLPISVQFEEALCEFWIWPDDDSLLDETAADFIHYTPADARAAYLSLCADLLPGANSAAVSP